MRLDICLPAIKIEVANLKLDNVAENEEVEAIDHEVEQVTKLGDLWELNEHRILCGDCLDKREIEKLMNNRVAEMVFIDPPYNLKAAAFCGKGKTQHKDFAKASGELKEKQFTEFLKDVFKNLVNISTDGSIHYVCMDGRHLNEILDAGNSCFTELKNLCV